MPGFLYYLPNARPASILGQLAAYGLGYLVDDEDSSLHVRECVGTAGSGVILGDVRNWPVSDVAMSNRITWTRRPKPAADRQAHVGILTGEALPTPENLARTRQLPGELHRMGDGNKWLIPNARQITDQGSTCALPTRYGIDEETGNWIRDSVVPRYRKIWDHATAYLESLNEAYTEFVEAKTDDHQFRFTIPNAQELAIDTISANYRISATELAILGVLGAGLIETVGATLVDDAGYARIQKKTALAIGDGISGDSPSKTADNSLDTPQP